MSSSGVEVEEFLLDVYCGVENEEGETCEFEAEVLAWSDPEIHAWGWVCPACRYEHERYDYVERAYD